MDDFLAFRKMITPVIIQILFWVGVVIAVLMGLGILLKGGIASVVGLLWIFLGPIAWRVQCEIIIVLFNIYSTLTQIRDALQNKE